MPELDDYSGTVKVFAGAASFTDLNREEFQRGLESYLLKVVDEMGVQFMAEYDRRLVKRNTLSKASEGAKDNA